MMYSCDDTILVIILYYGHLRIKDPNLNGMTCT